METVNQYQMIMLYIDDLHSLVSALEYGSYTVKYEWLGTIEMYLSIVDYQ